MMNDYLDEAQTHLTALREALAEVRDTHRRTHRGEAWSWDTCRLAPCMDMAGLAAQVQDLWLDLSGWRR